MYKNRIKRILGMAAVLCLAGVMLAGCGDNGTEETSNSSGSENQEEIVQQIDTSMLTTPGVDVNLVGEYSQEEMAGTWDDANATKIRFSGELEQIEGVNTEFVTITEDKLTISKGGTYVLQGDSTVQVVVDVPEEEQVQLVLHGVALTNKDTAPINIIEADRVMLTLADGTENLIQDTRAAYVEDETEKTAASEEELIEGAIYSEVDLVINGSGKLSVEAGFDDGIRTKDDLKLISGSYQVTSQDDAFVGKDSISICGGNYVVNATGAAFKSNQEEDLEKGFVVVDGGTFDLTATEGDGFHGEFVLVINAGDILIREAEEGLEAMNIVINGGTIDLTSTDDGINISEAENYTDTFGVEWADEIAAQSQAQQGMQQNMQPGMQPPQREQQEMPDKMELSADYDPTKIPEDFDWNQMPENMQRPDKPDVAQMPDETAQDTAVDHIPGALIINGGSIKVTAGGDGLDSNGDILITGGTTIVCGPTNSGNGSLDYADTFDMTGGTLVISGNQGMEQSINSETIPLVTVNFTDRKKAGSTVSIADANDKELFAFVANHEFAYVAYASADLVADETYTVTVNNESVEGTAVKNQSMMGFGGMGGRGQRPEGMEVPNGDMPKQ